ncbi:OmpH family outer membrane protein [bacterium]|nr:OmpH family outer membrane protein [bacterium]
MLKSRTMAWVLAIMVVSAGLMATAASAADQAQKIAVVDVEKVYTNAPRVKQYSEELNAFGQDLSKKVDIRNQNMMLNEAEIQELVTLKTKSNRTAAEDARIKEIESTERTRDDQYRNLQATKEPTDEQKAQLKELQDMRQKAKDTLDALAKDYDGQLKSKQQELLGKADADIRGAINKVAGEKGITMVIAKDAVLFGGLDITDDIIKNLDRKMQ